jgi:uncharacterized protein (UPF0332 family)
MEGIVKLYLERAENELILAESLFKISSENLLKEELEIGNQTFYSGVISHSYYCIFYCAKAFLMFKNIKTKPPNEHNKVYTEFKKLKEFINSILIEIYEEESIKAESLLKIFFDEKKKRGEFTYRKLPQANKEPAKRSLENAGKFFRNINLILRKND